MLTSRPGIGKAVTAVLVIIILVLAAGLGVYYLSPKGEQNTVTSTITQGGTTSVTTITQGGSTSTVTQGGSTTTITQGGSTTTSVVTSTTTTTASSSQTSTSSSSTGVPTTITMDVGVTPRSLDPASITDSVSEIADTQIYEELFYYNITTQSISPWLASGYTVSSDGLQYTVTLRQGINFADSTPFNADAVRFTVNRHIIMRTGIVGYYEGALKGAAVYAQSNKTAADVTTFENAGGVVVVDPFTVQFNLEAPDPSFLLVLSMVFLSGMVSPSYVNSHGGVQANVQNTYMDTHMGAGTGPYTGVYDQSTGSMVLKANPNYWGSPYNTGVAKIQNVVLNIVTDALKQSLDLKSGQANIIQFDATNLFSVADKGTWTSQNKLVSSTPNLNLIGPYGTLAFFCIMLNQNIKNPDGSIAALQPFRNDNVRLALQYAFDQKTYVNTLLNGIGQPMFGVIPKGMFGYEDGFPTPYPFNLTMAKQLLTAAGPQLGYSPDHPMVVTAIYPSGETGSQDMLTLLASNVNSLNTGFTIAVTPLSNPQYLSGFFSQTLQMGRILWGGDFPDPDSNLQAFANGISGTVAARMGDNNSEINSLLAQERSATDPAVRLQLVHQTNQMMAQEAWYVWGAQLSNIFGVSSSIKSFQVSGETTSPLFYFMKTG